MIYPRIYIAITKTLKDKQFRVVKGHADPIKQGLAKFFSLCFSFLFKGQIINSLGSTGHSLCHNYRILPL